MAYALPEELIEESFLAATGPGEIGRASCRERVLMPV